MRFLTSFVAHAAIRDPRVILEAFGPQLNRAPTLDSMPMDLEPPGQLCFEHLAGLFASTSLDHGVIAMTVRQSAYLFGLVRELNARKVIEIGRYKGGSTLLIAAAMGGAGDLWSVDIGEKEARHRTGGGRGYDEQIRSALEKYGLRAHLLVGDSRFLELDTGEVDLVFIDGDHSYEGVKNDFERFGRRVRVGGAIMFDDAADEACGFTSHADTVGRLVREIADGDEFRLARQVDRLAHVQRVR